jgi:putative ABC transport system permease protein
VLHHHLRYTLRLLRRSPGFTLVSVLTLALGIGANTAVFSVVDAVMLRPLPYPDAQRLVSLWEVNDERQARWNVAPANLVDYVRANRTFDDLAGFASGTMTLTKMGAPEQLVGEAVTWNLFSTLGVSPAIGRSFLPEEDRPGGAHVVILADALWRSKFRADPSVLGTSITLNGEPYEIVGVMPASFRALSDYGSSVRVAYFKPAAYPQALLDNHGEHEVRAVGRLKEGVTVSQAQADLKSISADLARRFPDTNKSVRALIAPLATDIARVVERALVVMWIAVALVLLIACVNLANLLIVRAVGQRHELAIRRALGASRKQIAADMLIRGLTLAGLGGAAGCLLGLWTRDALVALAPASIPRLGDVALDARVLAVTVALSLLAGVAAGLLPALQPWWQHDAVPLRTSGLTVAGSRSLMRWRGLLVAAEVAAAFVLAVAAGLLIRSLMHLNRVDLGFETERVLTLNVRLPEAKYGNQDARFRFFDEVTGRIAMVPGVVSVAFANQFPMRGGWGGGIMFNGPAGPVQVEADLQAVSPGYFATLGIPHVRGRLLTSDDRKGTMPVAVVSQTFVRQFLGDRDPIGFQFARNEQAPQITIVGVVGEIRRDGKTAEITPQVYLPAAQTDLYAIRLGSIAARAQGDPHALVAGIQRAVWAIDGDQPISGVRTLDEVVSASMAERRFYMTLLTVFAAIALGLALVGVYGVVAYGAAQRGREIGIRLALGASRRDVVALVVGGGLRWTVGGIAVGLLGAYATMRIMSSLLFEVKPTDPLTFGLIALATMVVAVGASFIPARRAAGADLVGALRAE